MLTTGPNLGLLDGGDYGEGVYHETLRMFRALDLLVQAHVISASTTTPPVAPEEGDAYLIPAGATGVWATRENQIARWTERQNLDTWEYFTPKINWQIGVDDAGVDGQIYRFNGDSWAGGGGGGGYTLPAATGSILGGVKVGGGLSVTVGGVLSATYSLPVASSSVLGGVKQGTGVSIAGDGTLTVAAYTLPTASGSVLGGIKVGTNLTINGSGVLSADAGGYTLPVASDSVLGGIKVGANLTINGSGVLSANAGGYTLPVATDSVLGGVKQGNNTFIDGAGVLSVADPYTLPAASAGTLGGVKIGSGLAIDGSNVLSATYAYTLPTASGSVLGGVKVGSGLAIDGSSVLSATYTYTLPVATSSVLGGVKDGTNVTIDGAGVLNLDTTLGLGVTLSAWDATYSGTIQNPAGAFWRLNTNDIGITLNAYNDGAWKYHHTAAAAIYDISSGNHIWYSAPSGTANTAITWLQGMELDTNGNFMIGAIAPSAWSLSGYKAIEISYAGNAWFSGYNDNMFTTNAIYTSSGWHYAATDSAALLGQSSGAFLWRAAPGGTAGAALSWTTNMLLDASGNLALLGNLAINTDKFTVAASSGNTVTAGNLTVAGNITVTGDLLVSGNTVTFDTTTVSVEDPLIKLAKANVADVVDTGIYAVYQPSATPLYTGLFRDATDGKYRLFDGLQVEPTATVNIAGTGFALAALLIGALTASSVNGNTITAGTGVLTIAAAKTLTASNTLTFSGTDGSTLAIGTGGTLGTAAYTATTAYLAAAGTAANSSQLLSNTWAVPGTIGSTTPNTIAASTLTATTVNGNTITTGTGTLTIAAGKTLSVSNTLTLAGADGTTMTFPATTATIARIDAANTFVGTQTFSGSVAATGGMVAVGSQSVAQSSLAVLNGVSLGRSGGLYGQPSGDGFWALANSYYNTDWQYVRASVGAIRFELDPAAIAWSLFTAPTSASAGDVITWRRQFQILHTAGATNNVTITGSAGGNPTINVTGGGLTIVPIVTMSAYGAGTATFSSGGVISSVSDERYKIKDGVIANPIPMLMALEPGYFYGKPEANMGEGRQLGFYAQNVRAAIGPEAAPDPVGDRPWGYYDRSVLAVAIEVGKNHEARIAALEAA